MKKHILLFLVTSLALCSCSKNNSGHESEGNCTPVITFSYSQSGVIKTDMTMVLTVEGKDYTFDKTSDEQTIYLKAVQGTIKFDCKVDESKTYTDKQDLSLSVKITAASISEDRKSYSALHTIVSHSISLGNIRADNVAEALSSYADIMNKSVTYSVNSKGIISVE